VRDPGELGRGGGRAVAAMGGAMVTTAASALGGALGRAAVAQCW